MEKIGSVTVADNQEKAVYGLVVFQRLSSLELINVQNTYTLDKSDKEDKPNETGKVPDDCRYYIRCVYANSKDDHGMGDGHSKFQTFRLLSLDLTDNLNNNSSANPYYHYYCNRQGRQDSNRFGHLQEGEGLRSRIGQG